MSDIVAGRHFKNEDAIKAKIVEGHRRGVCDSDGNSITVTDDAGRKGFIAKPRSCSQAKIYVYRKGRMVLKR